jgi:SagB-type dehydrogenase family enzyme
VEEALAARRSQRQFAPDPLPLAELGQLAWSAQGITDRANGYRTSPSAGAVYPLSVYFVTAAGVWVYLPATHALQQRADRDLREPLAQAALSQTAVRTAPCDVVITSVIHGMQRKYGDRATRYVAMEAGHVGQNLLLQATALGLVGVPIGAFDDETIRALLGLAAEEEPLYIIALGRPPAAPAR